MSELMAPSMPELPVTSNSDSIVPTLSTFWPEKPAIET